MKFTHYFLFFFAIILVLSIHSCANKAQGPTGGPKDTIPPRVLKSFPMNGSLNFKKKSIEIDFDENVSIEKPSENVIISPPQQKIPDVKAYMKKVTVDFNEALKDSTTYTVNFGNAIVDLDEKNVLKNYLFSFSTGDKIDTLQISGTVINSEDLNPISGVLVGIYAQNDSSNVFQKKPFLRISKTDNKGHFTISNIKKGTYNVYALDDVSHDYFYQPGEGLAMLDSMVTPTFRMEQMKDTVWKDSTHIDSVHSFIGTHFLPDNITLRYFKENKKRQYLVKSERKVPYSFSLFFNDHQKELPKIKPLNFNWDGKYIVEKSNHLDSLTYWLTDSVVWKTDTLQMAVTYLKSDSLLNLVSTTDTLNLSMRKLRISGKAAKSKAIRKIENYKFNTNMASTFEIYNPIIIRFDEPIQTADISKIHLSQKIDTTFKSIPFKWIALDSTRMVFAIENKWIAEKSYELAVDSASFTSIYKKTNLKATFPFKIRSLDEYSSMKILVSPFNPKAVIQVLDNRDQPLATKNAVEKGTVFEYLKPGEFYLRLFIDENGNGKWDTGDLLAHRQPEPVYYYTKKMTLKANWEFEETWNYLDTPLLLQKPAALKKDAAKKKE